MTDAWDPQQYARFRAERSRPFFDLLALVTPVPGGRVVDLGCGTGDLTRELHVQSGARETLGVDRSASMLSAAGSITEDGLSFREGDLRDALGIPGPWDVVFSNAAIQWAPEHPSLLATLRSLVRPGGQLAFQVPANFDEPSHVVARDLALEEPFRSALDGPAGWPAVLKPEEYALILHDLGATAQVVRAEIYLHVLEGPEQVVEWTRGTTLTPLAARLDPALFAEFVARYAERLLAVLPARRPFPFTFRRILAHARF